MDRRPLSAILVVRPLLTIYDVALIRGMCNEHYGSRPGKHGLNGTAALAVWRSISVCE